MLSFFLDVWRHAEKTMYSIATYSKGGEIEVRLRSSDERGRMREWKKRGELKVSMLSLYVYAWRHADKTMRSIAIYSKGREREVRVRSSDVRGDGEKLVREEEEDGSMLALYVIA